MKAAVAAFSEKGIALALRVARGLGAEVWAPARYAREGLRVIEPSLTEWAGARFADCGALVFVSACGIAVRAIAPFVKSKAEDPAVVVLDEAGENVVSLLSGHLGGANEIARKIAAMTGGRAVVTTATDVRGVTAVDSWAVANDCAVENVRAIKYISSAALEGRAIGVAVTDELQPAPWPVTLWLRPRVLTLGVGCKRGADFAALAADAEDFLEGAGVSPLSLAAVASIDIKKDEPAIIKLAEKYKVPFVTYGAEELRGAPGRFSYSERVERETGVGCVCERAAVLAAGMGVLMRGKAVYPGVTLALAKHRRKVQ
ncbi:cobalamin biosynthesis protein [Cloacibacillus sp. An23]|uniref:cobalt-precorrin 5A hydrolase n=1 Tax=Cloacibacillus sp. An23 TaxID=1965591 RepID=UPI000B39CA13|nr:cobalamin biosynthesis protein [Cloacibacillus sp. An23]OUO94442.1 cobalamin biosynthesis protein CbiG [Cloacibacillus sp. An23]